MTIAFVIFALAVIIHIAFLVFAVGYAILVWTDVWRKE